MSESLCLNAALVIFDCDGVPVGSEPIINRAAQEFDFGTNGVDFRGKTIIQRTSAGTQGRVTAANRADRFYAASLVTAADRPGDADRQARADQYRRYEWRGSETH